MSKHFIVLAGNIGSGKTSLARRLGERLDWQTGFESVADNPYLADFYADMRQWSFHLQIFFLGHRAEHHRHLALNGHSAITDRSIYEDAHIFARALHHLNNLNRLDYESYLRVYDLVVAGLPTPDLLIYLQAPVPALLERIQQRGRAIENGITAEYLGLLDSFYQEWIASFSLCPVLTLNTEQFNFVDNEADLVQVIEQIHGALP